MLVECVPNFSCDATIAAELYERALAHRAVTILGIESDTDHHRSVLTCAGPPRELLRALQELMTLAVERIDLRGHSGVHPRFGAADVIPFIPLGNTPMSLCIDLARELGAWAGDQLELPIYLYENATSRPEHRDLAALRRALKVASPPEPDFGPGRLHPSAGASCIGARPFLIAFNVELESEDLRLARRIAKTIRASNGGLPGVKAKAFRLETRGIVQVSMNLCDFKATGPLTVYRAIENLAAEHSIGLRGAELIGFIPEEAVERDFAKILNLDPDTFSSRILEKAIENRSPAHFALKKPFLEPLSSTAPAPGGGSAAAQTGALAAATALKALRFSLQGKQALQLLDGRSAIEEQAGLESLVDRFLGLSEDDARAFAVVAASWKLRKRDGDRAYRKRVKAEAMAAALTVCLEIVNACEEVARVAAALVAEGNPHLINDSALALTLALAAAEGAAWNARANSPANPDPEDLNRRLAFLQQAQRQVRRILAAHYGSEQSSHPHETT